jgi:hypothetical protein
LELVAHLYQHKEQPQLYTLEQMPFLMAVISFTKPMAQQVIAFKTLAHINGLLRQAELLAMQLPLFQQ